MAKHQARIVELQSALRIARVALETIRHGHSRCPEKTAEEALDRMWPLERKQPLQGLVGHSPRNGA